MDELEEFNRPLRNHYFDKLDWEEDEPSPLIPENIHHKFEGLEKFFVEICGYDVKIAEKESLNDRKLFDKFNENDIRSPNDFVYGEIVRIICLLCDKTFRTFSYVISHITYKLNINIVPGIFYDLGSVRS